MEGDFGVALTILGVFAGYMIWRWVILIKNGFLIPYQLFPEWANWHAIDKNGVGHFYENKPLTSSFGGWYTPEGRYQRNKKHWGYHSRWHQSRVKRLKFINFR